MTRIIAVDVHDVRFPTAAAGDGSDAINRGDYSATYVELRTDGPHTGAGFTFTNGRGNELTCAAVRALAFTSRAAPSSRWSPSRWRSCGRSRPTCSCAGSGRRRASCTWPPALWSTRCGTCGPRPRASRCGGSWPRCRRPSWWRASTSGTSTTRSPRQEATAILDKGRIGLEDRLAAVARDGFPSYTTSVGWLGYPDAQVRALARQAYAGGWRAMKMKVGGDIEDDVRRAGI